MSTRRFNVDEALVLNDILTHLSSRLPELEWKLSLQNKVINPALLPRGLFRSRLELTSEACIDEIKAELQAIKQQKNEQSALYLAERVGKKINVLVRLCHHKTDKKIPERQVTFGVQAIGTRQQWLQTMQNDIDTLTRQQQSLGSALVTLRAENNTQAILNLQVELGKASQTLTLAKETLERSTTLILC